MAMTEPQIAEQIAREAHAGQVDKAGQPYIAHVERVVANLLRAWPDATEQEIAAAWLHDVVEDTAWKIPDLARAGFSRETIDIVRDVTRGPPCEPYLEWIRTMCDVASVSALRVKLADNEDNSSSERVSAIASGPMMLATRYAPARVMLLAALSAPAPAP